MQMHSLSFHAVSVDGPHMSNPAIQRISLLLGKESGRKPTPLDMGGASRYTRRLVQIWDQLKICNGVLCRLYAQGSNQQNHVHLVIPNKLQEEILCTLHEGIAGGHLGINKTLNRLKERFYWPGHYEDVRNWCQTCAWSLDVKACNTWDKSLWWQESRWSQLW